MADVVGPVVIVIVAAALLVVFWRAGQRADRGRAQKQGADRRKAPTAEPQDNLDFWRAMDAGNDPTE